MQSTPPPRLHIPGWHASAHTPVVDKKYIDPSTGELRTSTEQEYSGPPAVDIIIQSIEEKTTQCVYRAQHAFPVEAVLWQIMRVVHGRKISIDSLTATPYAVRLILAHDLTTEGFREFYEEVVEGLFEGRGV